MTFRGALAVFALVAALHGGVVRADEPPPDPWALYHQAFSELAAGDVPAARRTLAKLIGAHPAHPAAIQATEVLETLGPPKQDEVSPAPARPDASLDLAPSARGELALVQTLNGAYLGVGLCSLLACDDTGPAIGLVLIGAVGGLAFSLATTTRGLADGDRAAINAGTAWGVWNGIALLTTIEEEGDGTLDGAELGGVILISDLVGTGVGLGVASQLDVKDVDVALATSVGVWAGLVGLFTNILLEDDGSFVRNTMLVSDVGFVAGIFLASRVDMSRARTLVIDAGGLLGGLVGAGAVYVADEDPGDDAIAAGALVGVLAGLGAATWFSRDFDARTDAQVVIAPTPGGATAGVVFAW